MHDLPCGFSYLEPVTSKLTACFADILQKIKQLWKYTGLYYRGLPYFIDVAEFAIAK